MIGLVGTLLMAVGQQEGSVERMREWIERWKAEDAQAREAASVKVVEAWKEWSEEALRALEEAGKSEDPEVGHLAKEALKRIGLRRRLGQEVLEAVPRIERAFLDGDEGERFEVLKKLWQKRGEVGEGGVRRVVETALEEKWKFDGSKFCEWVGLEKAIPLAKLLISMSRDPAADTRSSAARVLANLKAKEYAGEIVPLLSDGNVEVRKCAAQALGILEGKEHAAAIVPLLKDADVEVRRSAAEALGLLGVNQHAGAIVPLLRDSEEAVRRVAVKALHDLDAKEHAEDIVPLLKDSEADVRSIAAWALGYIGSKEHAGAIVPLFKDSEADVRSAAAWALCCLGAKEDAGAIVPLLEDSHAWVRRSAAEALGGLGVKEHAGVIVPLLRDSEEAVRREAVKALHDLDAKEHAGVIVPLLKDPERQVRISVAEALGSMGLNEHAGAIVPLLKDPERDVRNLAVAVLGELGDKEHAGSIVPLLEDSDARVRCSAALALGMLGLVECEKNLRNLERKDPSDEVRLGASIALIQLGAKDRREGQVVLRKVRTIAAASSLRRALSFALAEAHEAPVRKLLTVELGGVDSEKGLSMLLEREGWNLEVPERIESWEWRARTFRALLDRWNSTVLVEGKSVKIVSVDDALLHWEKVLQGK